MLHWQAHGLRYGITVAVRDDLDQGHDVLANLSRGVLTLAQARLERVVVLNLTARPDILVTRLGLRGREVGADLAERLARPAPVLPAGLRMISLADDGPLADTVTAAMAALYPGNS